MPQIDKGLNDELIAFAEEELEKVVKELCDAVDGEVGSVNKDKTEAEFECESRRRAVMEVIKASVGTQRLYFVIRSAIMGLMGAGITFAVVWYLGTIDLLQVVFLGVFVFIFGLVASRLLDKPIVWLSRKIVNILNRHERLKMFVMKKL